MASTKLVPLPVLRRAFTSRMNFWIAQLEAAKRLGNPVLEQLPQRFVDHYAICLTAVGGRPPQLPTYSPDGGD